MGSWVTIPLLALCVTMYALFVNNSWIDSYKKLHYPMAKGVVYNVNKSIDYKITVKTNTPTNLTSLKNVAVWEIIIIQNSNGGDLSSYDWKHLIADWFSIFQITELLRWNYYMYLDKDSNFVTNYEGK